ncbi:hypothetical protein N7510_005804 [Penicillium lagena]|uniref:uncharacterized protein n=1 Tax=Penicillium lagena TaxID=94218 RepID=UPI0025416F75|nr:uncharacterized protein N7510_005804 [Penicillium lagena]KAJ5612610.1 hypothetical protein N7510_005804 [Penicillium lagena]
MVLTQQERSLASSDDSFPTAQLFLLGMFALLASHCNLSRRSLANAMTAICRVAEPIALTSIFPYSWVMVKDFHTGNGNDASFYAGILISAFSLAEALTGMFWGGLSDRVGRKPILLSGCFGTMLSLLLVGFARNFWVALAGRALGGALNGNIGVIQTMVGELVKRPEHEPRAYAVMPFVWAIGTILGPAIGGLLAKPSEGFPSVFPANGLFGKFPYLLPNLVCSILLFLSIIISWFYLQETHPDMQPGRVSAHVNHPSVEQPLLATSGSTAHAEVDLRAESYGTFNQVDLHQEETWDARADSSSPTGKPEKPKAFTWKIVMLVVALAIFSYHSMSYDHLFPIFLQDKKTALPGSFHGSFLDIPGGVGLSTRTVGLIMSANGVIALFIQGVVFPALAHYLGIWRLFILVTVLHPIAYFMVPFLVFLPQNLVMVGIYTCLIVRNILSIIDYPVLLILIKQATPADSVMGKINGLAASAGAASRTIAPPVAGWLYSTGAEIGCTAIAWWASAFVAFMGMFQLWFIQPNRGAAATVSPVVSCQYVSIPDEPQKEVIEVIVTEVDDDGETTAH